MENSDRSIEAVEKRLRAARPEFTPAQRDRVKRTILNRTAPGRKRGLPQWRPALPRVVITAMLVAGFTITGASAGLAVSGISSSGSAGTAQYPRPTSTSPALGEVGDQNAQGNTGAGREGAGSNPVQPARQVASNDSDKLPFTGLAAIPLLLLGVVLLTGGVLLRRRPRLDA